MPEDAPPIPQARAVAVFCGSRHGTDPAFTEAAAALGRGLATTGIQIVYGGGSRGLMGVLADAALSAGGRIVGIIPRFLESRELAHGGLTELVVVEGMHQRKEQLLARADAVIVLPGGFGTMDELLEVLTWRLLGLHAKPIFICDVGHWFRGVRAAFDAAIAAGFADPAAHQAYEIVPEVAGILTRLQAK